MKSKEVTFLERRLFEQTALQTIQFDLKDFEILSDSENYSYEIIIHHIKDLLKNWSDRIKHSKKQSKLGKELKL